MTKKEIVKTISEEIGLTQLKTKEIVQKTFDAIVDTLVEDMRIELRNFGVFEVKKRAARKARNPRTGEKVFVPEKFVVTFKPGKEMEERVHELELQAAKAAVQQNIQNSPVSAEVPAGVAANGPAAQDALGKKAVLGKQKALGEGAVTGARVTSSNRATTGQVTPSAATHTTPPSGEGTAGGAFPPRTT
ncbi:MAG: HU family DNA-binding protein [Pirellulales bacterium]